MKRSRSPAQKRSVVLVFGESDNDRRALRHLTEGLRPDLVGKVQTRAQPLVLIKNATSQKARSNAEKIAAIVNQEARARTVSAVLAHEDCDAIEPAHRTAASRIENELRQAGCTSLAIGVTPAWELEAWWMLFPEAVASVVVGWREPNDWMGRSVGHVQDAKEALSRAVQPRPKRKSMPREYVEQDSIAIAQSVQTSGVLTSFANGARKRTVAGRNTLTRSDSFEEFKTKVVKIPR